MAMKPFLMGSEVEYSMSGPQRQTEARRTQYHQWLIDAIRSEHHSLPDVRTSSGIYIDNGSRYYLDSGWHNEFSSPELFTPRQIAVYDRAAEQILLRARAAVAARPDGVNLCITKNNVNFSMPDRAAWGQHEAYTCWIPLAKAARQLIPHLVTRIPYAGAGCLSAHRNGMGFELSQRARHMTRPTGPETTHDRAIFCTRAKPTDVSQAGWTRTNLISKDSQRCSFGMYLTYGVTGLMFLIMNAGYPIGRNVRLKDPVVAMRAISVDPWLQTKVRLANGKQATAIDIQRAYLRDATPHVESGDYPDWTCEVLKHWSATLDQLECNPLKLADRLDPYLKLTVFDHQLTRAGHSWATLRHALQLLNELRHTAPEAVVRAVMADTPSRLDGELQSLHRRLVRLKELQRIGIDCLRFAVRMQALELNYHELGGWFDQLDAEGKIDRVVVHPDEVKRAMYHAPAGGRAEARSKTIAELHGQAWCCDWQYLANDEEDEWVDLRDPFTNQWKVSPLDSSLPRHRRRLRISDLLG